MDGDVCVPEACGVGIWGDLPVDGATVYVDAAAAEGGDGSAEAPLQSIQPALEQAGSRGGGLVAVAAGSYAETLELGTDHAGVQLAGRCRELVTIDASVGDEDTPGIDIDSRYGEVEISGLSVARSRWIGVRVGSGVVRLVDLGVERSASYGILAYRGHSEAPSTLELEGCDIDSATLVGIKAADSGTQVALRHTVVRSTQLGMDGAGGNGIQVGVGATLAAEGCGVVGSASVGILAFDPGTQVLLRDTVVRTTQSNDIVFTARGLEVHSGATLAAEGGEVAENVGVGIWADGLGTRITLQGTVVRDTGPNTSGEFGYGILVSGGATVITQGGEVVGNTRLGVGAEGSGTRVTLRDTAVRDTLPTDKREFGYGIEVNLGAVLVVEGGEVSGNTRMGLLAEGTGTQLAIRNASISGTISGPGEQGMTALGLDAQNGASVEAYGLVAQDNEGPGLYAYRADSLACTDCALLDNRFAGAVVVNDSELEIRSSTISGTRECANLGGGVGIFAAQQWSWGPPSLIVADSTITDNPTAGVWLSGEGRYQLSGANISGNTGIPHGAVLRCGDGVYAAGTDAWDGSTGLSLEGNTLSGNAGAGLFLDDGWARLGGNTWSDNAPDLFVQGEACLTPREDWDEAPASEICPTWDRPTCELTFQLELTTGDIDPAIAPLSAPSALQPPLTPAPPLRAALPDFDAKLGDLEWPAP